MNMPNPLDEHDTLHTMHKIIPAKDYNRVRLALKRLSNPLHIDLTPMRQLEIILHDQYWLCFDGCMNNMPVLAWTEFETSGRSDLNAPVECELRLYHYHAGMVMGEVLKVLGKSLQVMLDSKR